MISTNWKATAAIAAVLALSVAVVACQSGSGPPQDESTWTNPIDEAVYIRVPAGPFLMGSTADESQASDRENPPQHTVTVDEFWIKQTEVTNAEYVKCVEAGACTAPTNAIWEDADYGSHPVDDVSWFQANDYADWVGGRLCTEAEWEKACRGTDGRVWPWGDDFDASKANVDDTVGTTSPVGAYSPQGDSPYGMADIAGNAWEWTTSLPMPYPYDPADGREDAEAGGTRVLRGGAFYSNLSNAHCAARYWDNPHVGGGTFGFRVCASP